MTDISAPRPVRRLLLASCVLSASCALPGAIGPASAADLTPPAAPAIGDGIEIHGQGNFGILANPANPSQGSNGSGYNFGHLNTDHANEPQFNQLLLTVTKPIDPQATGYAFGFVLQGLIGTDERFNHFLGIGAADISGRNQAGIFQAIVTAHLPWLTPLGIDVKAGLYTSPMGPEATDPTASPFYSHAYTYNYTDTFNHTGILTTTHINPTVDVYLGVDTGNQTSFGFPNGDPNHAMAGMVGLGLNHLLNDKLTVFALSHIGPEQSLFFDPNADKDIRSYNDVFFTYKINDDWTSITEFNYSRDNYGVGNGPAVAYSAVQYLAYAYNTKVTFNARAEVFRDSQNFYVLTSQDNVGFVKTEIGNPFNPPNPANLIAPNGTQGTTYGGLTLGLAFKPDVPKPLTLITVRPEIRYDRILAGSPAFNSNVAIGGIKIGSRNQFTFGGDVIVGF